MDEQYTESAAGTAGLLRGWLTRAQVASELGVSVDTLARWQAQDIGPPCARIGRKVVYRVEAFREWLISRERERRSSKKVSPRRRGLSPALRRNKRST
jgi:hypothetical protein